VRPVGRHLRLAAAVAATFFLSACAQQPMSEQGKKVYTLYNIVLVIALVIGFGVVGMILLSCVRYRKRPGDDELPPQTHGNTTFEIIWTAVPTVIVLALFGMSFATIRAIDKPVKDVAAVVEIRGYQWAWTFDYGKNSAGMDVLVRTNTNTKPPVLMLPVGQKVHFEERSDNVIHSFFVPAFLFKRDVVPGRANGFDLTVSSPGVYQGQCAELCGTEHAKMTFVVKAVGRAEFDKWFQTFQPPRPECTDTSKAAATTTIHSVPGAAKFVEECAYLKAGTAKVTFANGGGLPHNVAVIEGVTPPGTLLGAGKIIQSGSNTFDVSGLKAGGDYTFYCQVHTQMQGRVVVQ
jgi:cytochrome c oxidase subunit 2